MRGTTANNTQNTLDPTVKRARAIVMISWLLRRAFGTNETANLIHIRPSQISAVLCFVHICFYNLLIKYVSGRV